MELNFFFHLSSNSHVKAGRDLGDHLIPPSYLVCDFYRKNLSNILLTHRKESFMKIAWLSERNTPRDLGTLCSFLLGLSPGTDGARLSILPSTSRSLLPARQNFDVSALE